MNIPDFNKYGVLKYFKFKTKTDRFSYIKYPNNLGNYANDKIRTKVHTALLDMFNSKITAEVTSSVEDKLDHISHYVDTIKIHPLDEFEIDAKYTSLDSVTEMVMEETEKIFLPTVKTSSLIKEIFRRL